MPKGYGQASSGLSGVSGLSSSGVDRAASFNGTTQSLTRVNTTIGVGEGQSGTISFWVNVGGGETDPQNTFFLIDDAVGSGGLFYIKFDPFNNTTFIAADTSGGTNLVSNAAVDLQAGTWHHVVLVSSGTAWTLYVNGTARTLTVVDGSNIGHWFQDINPSGTGELYIGVSQDADTYFNGVMDELGIWSTAFSSAQVTTLYNAGTALTYGAMIVALSTPLHYWSLSTNHGGITAAQVGGQTLTNNASVADAAGNT